METEPKKRTTRTKILITLIIAVLICDVVIALPFIICGISGSEAVSFAEPTGSMEPTIHGGTALFMSKADNLSVGDIIAFHTPQLIPFEEYSPSLQSGIVVDIVSIRGDTYLIIAQNGTLLGYAINNDWSFFINSAHVGDNATFIIPYWAMELDPHYPNASIVHRIIYADNITSKYYNGTVYFTKGDNNSLIDPWLTTPSRIEAKISFCINYVGLPFMLVDQYFSHRWYKP
jgi:signal peptidase I